MTFSIWTLSILTFSIWTLETVMLSGAHAYYHKLAHYAECRYAECRGAQLPTPIT